jgi:hypothetical protein
MSADVSEQGGLAFPLTFQVPAGSFGPDGNVAALPQSHVHTGMTLRDYFAAKAMQAALAYRRRQFETDNEDHADWDYFIDEYVAPEAYRVADAMLKVRSE